MFVQRTAERNQDTSGTPNTPLPRAPRSTAPPTGETRENIPHADTLPRPRLKILSIQAVYVASGRTSLLRDSISTRLNPALLLYLRDCVSEWANEIKCFTLKAQHITHRFSCSTACYKSGFSSNSVRIDFSGFLTPS